MNKSFEGLSHLIEQTFPGKILTGSHFIFLNKRKTHIKILTWEQDGYAIYYKRLEQGTYLTKNQPQKIQRKQLLLILEGVVPKRIQKRYKTSLDS